MIRFLIPFLAAAPFIYPLSIWEVHDGDTFTGYVEIRPGLIEVQTVRLPCGNAAEIRADGGGWAARDALAKEFGCQVTCTGPHINDCGVVNCSHDIRLTTDWKKEKFGRLLADPVKPDGGSICADLVDAGWLK